MRGLPTATAALALLVLFPAAARAQASITGVVKDSTGAVLPGVTVEASSPALIEKVRTAVTDGTGQYRIVDLRPGVYTVTFTLAGFGTVRREGIELTGSFTATVNAELRVGARRGNDHRHRRSADRRRAEREAAAGARAATSSPPSPPCADYNALVVLVPGVTGSERVDVATSPSGCLFAMHGGRANEGRVQVDGINVGAAVNGGGVSGYITDIGNAQEVTFTTSGGLGEAELGGPLVNIVPRTGGNTVKGSFLRAAPTMRMQGSNYTPI